MNNEKSKRVPKRRCIICRNSFDKSVLVRFVKNADGAYVADTEKKMNGRGCYVCQNSGCLEKAGKRGVRF